ncbi:fibronectin type III domain-containing protein [Ornithinimicrobium sp. F0845]|uniref:fibronectin type III domain-containing protein n=1 Tax=Ornithinimicrobium sp. F0845 TaxID=2926412 RepID=UPI001FF3290C|nr:fibronectin type III domain-containing protein [Ornithinimicrobium sp. F0845]MCK0113076.1 fibronectin type III domain-containing protein [Ornithinimicrobium sp. F0845]
MADPVVELEPVAAAVEPGGQTRVVVTVVNEGTIVEGYRVEVLDDVTGTGRDVVGPASWSEVLPAEGGRTGEGGEPDLTVYPGQQGVVVVVFSPPVGTRVPGGRCAFAIRVSSVVDPDTSTVIEGDLDIGKVTALQAKLVPVTSTGRWRGKHLVELSNWGNTPARLRVVAEDPDRALGFLVQPDTVELPVGASAQVRLKARTRKPTLRGTAARLPFTVRAEPADGAPTPQAPPVPGMPLVEPHTATVDGAFNQKPILTKGVVLGAGLVLVGVAGLTAYGLMTRGDGAQNFQELGVPDTPEVSVEATGPESVRVSWIPLDQVEGYKLFQLDAQGAVTTEMPLAPELGATPVEGLAPDQEHCFTMAAVRGEVQSPQSAPVCAHTPVAAPTDEPTTTGPPEETTEAAPTTEGQPTDTGAAETTGAPTTDGPAETGATATAVPPAPPTDEPPFEPGEWAAVVGVFPALGTAGETGATQLVEDLEAEGVEALAVNTEEFPDLGLAEQGWLVLLDGKTTFEEASQACQDVQAALPELVGFCNPPVQPVSPVPVETG